MKQVGICGNFGAYQDIANGQMIKTKVLTQELEEYFGKENISIVDTYLWSKNPIKLLLQCFRLVILCKNIIILPAHNGIKIFAPLFKILCKIFNRKLHYSVIGGWLPEFLSSNPRILKSVRSMDGVYVETKSMKEKLINLGINNVIYMPNFKKINIVDIKKIKKNHTVPYKLCTFSRVKKEKGIIDAINAVNKINDELNKIVFTLDIYGTIEEDFKAEFKNAIDRSNKSCTYKGVIEFNNTTEVLKDYFALVFPTYYEGEGFPGTIIDSFSSGLPVIATDWKYNSEIISNKKNGLIYKSTKENKEQGLTDILNKVYDNPEIITSMKNDCILEAKKYNPSHVMSYMIDKMEDK